MRSKAYVTAGYGQFVLTAGYGQFVLDGDIAVNIHNRLGILNQPSVAVAVARHTAIGAVDVQTQFAGSRSAIGTSALAADDADHRSVNCSAFLISDKHISGSLNRQTAFAEGNGLTDVSAVDGLQRNIRIEAVVLAHIQMANCDILSRLNTDAGAGDGTIRFSIVIFAGFFGVRHNKGALGAANVSFAVRDFQITVNDDVALCRHGQGRVHDLPAVSGLVRIHAAVFAGQADRAADGMEDSFLLIAVLADVNVAIGTDCRLAGIQQNLLRRQLTAAGYVGFGIHRQQRIPAHNGADLQGCVCTRQVAEADVAACLHGQVALVHIPVAGLCLTAGLDIAANVHCHIRVLNVPGLGVTAGEQAALPAGEVDFGPLGVGARHCQYGSRLARRNADIAKDIHIQRARVGNRHDTRRECAAVVGILAVSHGSSVLGQGGQRRGCRFDSQVASNGDILRRLQGQRIAVCNMQRRGGEAAEVGGNVGGSAGQRGLAESHIAGNSDVGSCVGEIHAALDGQAVLGASLPVDGNGGVIRREASCDRSSADLAVVAISDEGRVLNVHAALEFQITAHMEVRGGLAGDGNCLRGLIHSSRLHGQLSACGKGSGGLILHGNCVLHVAAFGCGAVLGDSTVDGQIAVLCGQDQRTGIQIDGAIHLDGTGNHNIGGRFHQANRSDLGVLAGANHQLGVGAGTWHAVAQDNIPGFHGLAGC